MWRFVEFRVMGYWRCNLGPKHEFLVDRNCTILDFSATYSQMQEKFINNGLKIMKSLPYLEVGEGGKEPLKQINQGHILEK